MTPIKAMDGPESILKRVYVEFVMSDYALRQDILEELAFDPQFNAAHIGVAVDDGVVTLTGHVAHYAEKLAVEQAVRRVKGVRAIAEEVEVRVPNHKRTADDEIAKRAADILRWSASVPADSVQITVHDGWVQLEGEVPWHFQRAAIQNQLSRLSGLVGIVNNIMVKNQPHAPEIKDWIAAAFRRHAEIDPKSIRVSVQEGGLVALEGAVQGWGERDAVEGVAWATPGVTGVENHLRVL